MTENTIDQPLTDLTTPVLLVRMKRITASIIIERDRRDEAKGAVEYAERHNVIADLRQQRDAVEAELTRRADGMERALVTVEAVERVLRGMDTILAKTDTSDEGIVDAVVAQTREAIDLLMEATTDTTCTLVKGQSMSDRISVGARARVAPIIERVSAIYERMVGS